MKQEEQKGPTVKLVWMPFHIILIIFSIQCSCILHSCGCCCCSCYCCCCSSSHVTVSMIHKEKVRSISERFFHICFLWFRSKDIKKQNVCVCVCEVVSMCICVCEREQTKRENTHTHTDTSCVYAFLKMYLAMARMVRK